LTLVPVTSLIPWDEVNGALKCSSNRKVGTLQLNAYGSPENEYLKLRILNRHNTIYASTG
jgi:hypothetical protein